MKPKFDPDNKFYAAMGRAADLLRLNLLWLLGCLPVVTIVSSTSAMYYVTFKMAAKEDSHIARTFFREFKRNLKVGIILSVIFVVALLLIVFDYYQFFRHLDGTLGVCVNIIVFVFAILYLLIASWISPMLSRFENTALGTIKNAFLMSVSYFAISVIVTILNISPLILWFGMPFAFYISSPFWLLLGGAVIAFANSHVMKKAMSDVSAQK